MQEHQYKSIAWEIFNIYIKKCILFQLDSFYS